MDEKFQDFRTRQAKLNDTDTLILIMAKKFCMQLTPSDQHKKITELLD